MTSRLHEINNSIIDVERIASIQAITVLEDGIRSAFDVTQREPDAVAHLEFDNYLLADQRRNSLAAARMSLLTFPNRPATVLFMPRSGHSLNCPRASINRLVTFIHQIRVVDERTISPPRSFDSAARRPAARRPASVATGNTNFDLNRRASLRSYPRVAEGRGSPPLLAASEFSQT
jgi:hypothetical protein